jgi:hypothetical protein
MGKKAAARRVLRRKQDYFEAIAAPSMLPPALQGLAAHRDLQLYEQIAASDLTFAHPTNYKKLDQVFGKIEGILRRMEEEGETECLPDGTPIFFDEGENAYFPIVGSLYSMCDVYDILAQTHGWPAQPPGLRQLGKKFEYGMVMAQHDTDAARKTMEWMRECMLTITPRDFSASSAIIVARDELMAERRQGPATRQLTVAE